MSIELSILAPHFPSICHEDQVPEFQEDIKNAMKDLSKDLKELNLDVIVLVSCHWPSTFTHYIDCTPTHKGLLTATEAPDLIKDVPYQYPGDEELGQELVQAAQTAGIQTAVVNDSHFVWDYGTVVPLRYLVPNEDIPVINISVTLTASLDETYQLGREIAKVLRASDKKAVFVASGALSHNLVRGRHHKPTLSEHALDKEFVHLLSNKDYQAAYKMLPQYSGMAKVESGGRHLAMLFGILNEDSVPTYLGDAQSSGSWNVLMTFGKTRISHQNENAAETFAK
nr:MEMO1 family protein [uncultured Bacillus sp.]